MNRFFAWRIAFAALSTISALASTAHAANTRQWTVIELTADSAYGGSARAINNKGDVAGQTFRYENGQYISHAYLWQNGVRTDIGAGVGQFTIAWAMNERGTIVGYADGRATVWRDGVASPLGFIGDATGINKFGTIIGRAWTGGAYGYGANPPVMLRDGALTQLPSLGGTWAGTSAINDKGLVAGSSYLPRSSTFRAVVWQDGVIRELPGLGGSDSLAAAMNNHGVIIGTAFDAAGKQWMVRWASPDAPPEKLMERGAGYALNDHGDIAGNNLDTGKPFLLERDGTLTWLLDLPAMQAGGWHSFGVSAMNDRGWIIGSAWKPGVSNLGTALLLIPR